MTNRKERIQNERFRKLGSPRRNMGLLMLTKFYDKTLKENHYIFAHFFLSMIANIILAVILSFINQPAYRLQWHMRVATFMVGVGYEIYQHKIGTEKGLKGSTQDVIMNQLGCENIIGLYY